MSNKSFSHSVMILVSSLLCDGSVVICCSALFHSPSVVLMVQHFPGARNSSVGCAWALCPQCRGFDPPLGTFSGRGNFSLGVNMGSNSIPPKTPSDESINRGLVCAHMHFIARTQKILTFRWMPATKKHTQHAPSTKTECDYLNGWIKNGHIRKNLTQKWWTPEM